MAARLDGTVIVVTGASSGIGNATARALAAEGAHVALFARRRDKLEDLAKEIADAGTGGASVHEVDVTEPDAVRRAVDAVAAEQGHLDVLVNNAGYGTMDPAMEADLSEWQKMIDINISGVLASTHAAVGHLTEAAKGPRGIADVVTVSSVAGRVVTGPGSNVYAATKHAVNAFSEALRQEFGAKHVRVGLVEPGLVDTELTNSGREHTPDASSASELGVMEASDIADAVVYMVTRPPRTAVNEMLIRPTEQER